MNTRISRAMSSTAAAWITAGLLLLPAMAGYSEEKKPEPAGAAVNLASSLPPAATLDTSLANEVNTAISRGLKWLAAKQKPDGSWSDGNFPALTALPVWALSRAAAAGDKDALDKGIKYILTCVRDNGGIYKDVAGRKGGGLSNYNTAICMTALHATGRPDLAPIVRKARTYIAGSQHFGDDTYAGGFGYDRETDRKYTDLLNTAYVVEAMKLTESAEDTRPKTEKRADIDWKETVKYIERMQNKSEAGEDAGGFFYNPSDPKAGTRTNAQGMVVFRSYGSITYAGLLALVYANVSKDDVRVKSAFDWATKHWTLDENPGMGPNGLFYFYNVLSKSLNVFGADVIPLKDGKTLAWRTEAAKKLLSLQQVDTASGGVFWINKEGRWMESDPVLVTSYTLLALESIIKQ